MQRVLQSWRSNYRVNFDLNGKPEFATRNTRSHKTEREGMLIPIFVFFVLFVATRYSMNFCTRAAVHFNAEDAESTESRREKREWTHSKR